MKKKFNFNKYFLTISEKLFSNTFLIKSLQRLKKKILDCKKKKKKIIIFTKHNNKKVLKSIKNKVFINLISC